VIRLIASLGGFLGNPPKLSLSRPCRRHVDEVCGEADVA
jgi:hypothetical protein